jgi:calcineurin-like phosphoesterase family protein
LSKLFLTSDQHFFHGNIIKYCDRPFDDEYKMNDLILENYNDIITDDDTVIHLGDLSAGLQGRTEQFKETLQKLKGRKILLKGNHDHIRQEININPGFESVGQYLAIGKYFLNHYGLEENQYVTEAERSMRKIFEQSGCNTIIHGHSHTRCVEQNEANGFFERINVSVDLNDFKPLELIL